MPLAVMCISLKDSVFVALDFRLDLLNEEWQMTE